MKITDQQEVKCLAIFQSCASSLTPATMVSDATQEVPRNSIGIGAMIVTAEGIHLTTSFQWLCDNINDKMFASQTLMSQPMSNLVELENVTRTTFTLNFMDELDNTIEKWKFVFEAYPRIARTLHIIDSIWREIFCVPLINDDQILS